MNSWLRYFFLFIVVVFLYRRCLFEKTDIESLYAEG